MNCTTCGNPIQEGMQFCTNCGAPVQMAPTPSAPTSAKVCSNCGTPIEPGMAFCIMCGTPVAADAPTEIMNPLDASPAAAAKTPPVQQSPYAQPVPAQAQQQPLYAQPAPAQAQQQSPYAQQPAPVQNAYPQQGSQVQTKPAPAQSQTPHLQQSKPKKKSKKGPIIGAIVAVVIVAVVVVGGVFTNWFGIPGMISGTASAAIDVEAKASVNDYTWEELSKISEGIASASSDEAALEIEKKYNLVNDSGELDGSQTKQVALTDGTVANVQIIGFRHDDKVSGGKAGITFQFVESPYRHKWNNKKTNEGGWKSSDIRSYLNDDFVNLLPEDLRGSIVEVSKLSNNKGKTSSASDVSATSDKVWLLSMCEVGGISSDMNDVLKAEGSQYQYYEDMGIAFEKESKLLLKPCLDNDGKFAYWWLRSSRMDADNRAYHIVDDGKPSASHNGEVGKNEAVAPGFCI